MVSGEVGVGDSSAASAKSLVRHFEGCRAKPYLDSAGIATVGYGAIYRLNGSRVQIDDNPLTQEEIDRLLDRDLGHAFNSVVRLLRGRTLRGNQLAALTDFTFNLGAGTFQHSTLRQMILQGEDGLAGEQFGRYVLAGGRRVNGLVKRREAERQVWVAVN